MLDFSPLQNPKLLAAQQRLEQALPVKGLAAVTVSTRTVLCALLRKGYLLGGDAEANSLKWADEMVEAIGSLTERQKTATCPINTMPAYLRALMLADYPERYAPKLRQYAELERALKKDLAGQSLQNYLQDSPSVASDRVTIVTHDVEDVYDRWGVVWYLQQAALSALQPCKSVK